MCCGTRRMLTVSSSFFSHFLRCVLTADGSGSSTTRHHQEEVTQWTAQQTAVGVKSRQCGEEIPDRICMKICTAMDVITYTNFGDDSIGYRV